MGLLSFLFNNKKPKQGKRTFPTFYTRNKEKVTGKMEKIIAERNPAMKNNSFAVDFLLHLPFPPPILLSFALPAVAAMRYLPQMPDRHFPLPSLTAFATH